MKMRAETPLRIAGALFAAFALVTLCSLVWGGVTRGGHLFYGRALMLSTLLLAFMLGVFIGWRVALRFRLALLWAAIASIALWWLLPINSWIRWGPNPQYHITISR